MSLKYFKKGENEICEHKNSMKHISGLRPYLYLTVCLNNVNNMEM